MGKVGAPMEWDKFLNNKSDFKNEKEYQQFIEDNIVFFCENVLKLGKYISHKSNSGISGHPFGKSKERPDLIIEGKKGSIMVEIKYPKNDFCELRNAIGQALNYICQAELNPKYTYDRICIVSPCYDERIFNIIKKFNLPIELYFLTKNYHSKIKII